MVRQWQELTYDKRYYMTTTERGPDFVKLADANGLKGSRVTQPGGAGSRHSGSAGRAGKGPRLCHRLHH